MCLPSRHGCGVNFLCFLFTNFITCCLHRFGGFSVKLRVLWFWPLPSRSRCELFHGSCSLTAGEGRLPGIYLTWPSVWRPGSSESGLWSQPLRGPLTLFFFPHLGLCVAPPPPFLCLLSTSFVRGKKSPIYLSIEKFYAKRCSAKSTSYPGPQSHILSSQAATVVCSTVCTFLFSLTLYHKGFLVCVLLHNLEGQLLCFFIHLVTQQTFIENLCARHTNKYLRMGSTL